MDAEGKFWATIWAIIGIIVIAVVSVFGTFHYKETLKNVERDRHFVEHCKLVRTETSEYASRKYFTCMDKVKE